MEKSEEAGGTINCLYRNKKGLLTTEKQFSPRKIGSKSEERKEERGRGAKGRGH